MSDPFDTLNWADLISEYLLLYILLFSEDEEIDQLIAQEVVPA